MTARLRAQSPRRLWWKRRAQSGAAAPPARRQPRHVLHRRSDARISIDDFMKVELRVAKVLEAEAVPKSKKLVKLKVDVGSEHRTIVAGIAEAYPPDQLVGHDDRHRRQSQAGKADGNRIERHGAGGQSRGWITESRGRRSVAAARVAGAVDRTPGVIFGGRCRK